MTIFECSKCGRRFNKKRGLQVHQSRTACGGKGLKKKNGKTAKTKTTSQPVTTSDPKESIVLSVPCNLGGNNFIVDIDLGIKATGIRVG
jgi:hypothetical protein